MRRRREVVVSATCLGQKVLSRGGCFASIRTTREFERGGPRQHVRRPPGGPNRIDCPVGLVSQRGGHDRGERDPSLEPDALSAAFEAVEQSVDQSRLRSTQVEDHPRRVDREPGADRGGYRAGDRDRVDERCGSRIELAGAFESKRLEVQKERERIRLGTLGDRLCPREFELGERIIAPVMSDQARDDRPESRPTALPVSAQIDPMARASAIASSH